MMMVELGEHAGSRNVFYFGCFAHELDDLYASRAFQ